ncbi:MAG: AtpZ/AtpI family protein [Chloroflexota bacterium]|nr:AtpZ/AtpI family protein [Chloroflexota bacterium]
MSNEPQGKKTKRYSRSLSLTTLGWELALPIFGGVLLGYQIDSKTAGSGYTYTFSLLILGIFVGYYNLYKYIHLEMLRTKFKKRNIKNGGDA